jgi:hypothetical protein
MGRLLRENFAIKPTGKTECHEAQKRTPTYWGLRTAQKKA